MAGRAALVPAHPDRLLPRRRRSSTGSSRSDGNWKPALGLDLQGGTRITLIAHR